MELNEIKEQKEVNFYKCDHSGVQFKDGQLVCKCGAAWGGYGLNKLFTLFTKKVI